MATVYTFPFVRKDFQKLFMRIDVIKPILDIQSETEEKRESSIYLPLPVGLLRENHSLTWEGTEFEILGELVKQNFDSVFDNISALQNRATEFDLSGTYDILGDSYEGAKRALAASARTALDSAIANFSAFGAETIRQSLGVAPRANYSMLFKGIDQPRDFVLEWNLFPKNYHDAKAIETIIKVLQKAALPDLRKKTLLDAIVEEETSIITDKSETQDVVSSNPRLPTGLYSVTYNIPNKIKIKLYERINNDNYDNIEESSTEIREITHLMNFPFEMIIRNIIVEHTEDSINPPLVKHQARIRQTDDTYRNVSEYFHTTYKVRLSISDMTLYTRESVNSSFVN